jgi:hypothetical protein
MSQIWYLKLVMERLTIIVEKASQDYNTTKDDVLTSIKHIIDDYNNAVPEEFKINLNKNL